MDRVIRDNNLSCDREDSINFVCDAYQQGKSHQLPYPKLSSVSKFPLDLVFSDVWGPAVDSVGRNQYYVSFIDDYSKFVWIYLIRYKSDVFKGFHEFQQLIEHLFNQKIVAIQTAWGASMRNSTPFLIRSGSLI